MIFVEAINGVVCACVIYFSETNLSARKAILVYFFFTSVVSVKSMPKAPGKPFHGLMNIRPWWTSGHVAVTFLGINF